MKMPWSSRRMRVVFLLLVLLVSGCSQQSGQTVSAGRGAEDVSFTRLTWEGAGHTVAQLPTGQRMAANDLSDQRVPESTAVGHPEQERHGANHAADALSAQTAVIAMPQHYPAVDPLGLDKREQELTAVERFGYEGLLQPLSDQTYGPALASDYRVENRDGKPVITVRLRPGGKWPDGQPITVDDVRATLELYAKPEYYGIWRSQLALLEGASAFRAEKAKQISGIVTDAASQTIQLHLTQEDRSFLPILTAPLLSHKQLAGKGLPEIERLAKAGQLLGAGPFQVESIAGDNWTFSANLHYYAGTPRLKALHVRRMTTEQAQAAVQAGEVHIAWVAPGQAAQLAKKPPENLRLVTTEAAGYHFLGFNLTAGPAADRQVRRALVEALSAKKIAHDRFFGMGKIADGPLSPLSFAYKPQPLPAYNLQQAARTLADKGYSKAHPLVLAMVYPQDAVRERLFQAVQEAWRPLPVKVTAKPLPADEFAAHVFGASPYDLYLFGWKDGQDPSVLNRLWHSREKPGELGFNASHYYNAKADRLLDSANGFLPQAERKRLYAEWQALFAHDLPIMPLVRLPESYVVAKRLHGIEADHGVQPFGGSWKWSLGE